MQKPIDNPDELVVMLGVMRPSIPQIFSMKRIEDAYSAMAESLNVAVEELTDAQKRQAALDAVLAATNVEQEEMTT